MFRHYTHSFTVHSKRSDLHLDLKFINLLPLYRAKYLTDCNLLYITTYLVFIHFLTTTHFPPYCMGTLLTALHMRAMRKTAAIAVAMAMITSFVSSPLETLGVAIASAQTFSQDTSGVDSSRNILTLSAPQSVNDGSISYQLSLINFDSGGPIKDIAIYLPIPAGTSFNPSGSSDQCSQTTVFGNSYVLCVPNRDALHQQESVNFSVSLWVSQCGVTVHNIAHYSAKQGKEELWHTQGFWDIMNTSSSVYTTTQACQQVSQPPPTTQATGFIQGFKVLMPGYSITDPFISKQVTTVNGPNTNNVQNDDNPYFYRNLTPGTYRVEVTVPQGYTVGYSACTGSVTCHGTIIPGNVANVTVPAGSYVDLYWHFTPNQAPAAKGVIQGVKVLMPGYKRDATIDRQITTVKKVGGTNNGIQKDDNPYAYRDLEPGDYDVNVTV
ncbi:MAG: hypothetical protein JWM56_981, partial [Candidatus Peribacteria bacterium]|nr:hypothetical protein [Candidatus Peribacteria bacterium]